MQQPCGSKIKQQTWTLIAEPGASIEQTLQSECPGEITKIMIIIIELDKPLMLPAGIFSFSIPGKDLWSADVQLCRNVKTDE
ncbi:hypothetical protein KATP_47400 (plasmid) [Kluyvera ascorbata]|nr:hypothetical protein KATP_47400 [Kluyvera ascorbata]